jgi:hypothetical protein
MGDISLLLNALLSVFSENAPKHKDLAIAR